MAATAILPLPPAAAIADAIAEMAGAAANDTKRLIALNKAQYDLMLGTQIVIVPGAFLVPSSSRSGLIHRVDHLTGCSCEAGQHGRACRHKLAIEVIELAQTRTMPSLGDRIAAQRRAKQAADAFNAEIFG
jgi:hypothetical protein